MMKRLLVGWALCCLSVSLHADDMLDRLAAKPFRDFIGISNYLRGYVMPTVDTSVMARQVFGEQWSKASTTDQRRLVGEIKQGFERTLEQQIGSKIKSIKVVEQGNEFKVSVVLYDGLKREVRYRTRAGYIVDANYQSHWFSERLERNYKSIA